MTDLNKLAWLASRPYPYGDDRGKRALHALQTALKDRYPTQFSAAISKAKKRDRRVESVVSVIFAPTMERAVRKYQSEETQRFYRANFWPFVVTTNPGSSRQTAVVVWDSIDGYNVSDWATRRGNSRTRYVKTADGRVVARPQHRHRRDLPESIGHHGYTAPRQLTHAERLRLIAERRRRYRQTAQSQGHQGPGYDLKRKRRRRTRRRTR
jgi:hypothetical protein